MAQKIVTFLLLMSFVTLARAQDKAPSVVEIEALDGHKLSFGVDEISGVRVNDNESFNQITFQVDETTAKLFATLTTENVGAQIIIKVCGEEVSNPVVQTPIFGGVLVLSGFTNNKAQEIGHILTGSRSCR